jgi:hypothetical protein
VLLLAPTHSEPQDERHDGGNEKHEHDDPQPVPSVFRSDHQCGTGYPEH